MAFTRNLKIFIADKKMVALLSHTLRIFLA